MIRLSILLVLVSACGGDDKGGSGDGDGDAGGMGDDGDGGGSNGGGDACGTLHGVIRDFQIAHPDFEVTPPVDKVISGIVMPTITPGGVPTLSATPPADDLIESATTFAQWYVDVAGVNMHFEKDFVLTPGANGTYVFDQQEYFPIDNMGYGNEGNPHNYHFTTELHASFPYKGGEKFTFRGDDDVWVFVNGKLAIDLGGVHSANEQTIDFDAKAAELGLTLNQNYPIDFFQAERHVTGSSFRIETTIACFIVF